MYAVNAPHNAAHMSTCNVNLMVKTNACVGTNACGACNHLFSDS